MHNTGFQGSITVKDVSDQHILYKKTFTSKDKLNQFITYYSTSKKGASLLLGAAVPIRTDDPQDFAKDLFLPTFVNFALKIDNLALKVFASIGAIIFDVLTLAPRFVLTPFRIMENDHQLPQEKHRMISLISPKAPGAEKSLKKGVVNLHYEMKTITACENDTSKNTEIEIKGMTQVALKTLPNWERSKFSSFQKTMHNVPAH